MLHGDVEASTSKNWLQRWWRGDERRWETRRSGWSRQEQTCRKRSGSTRSANYECAAFHKTRRIDEPPSTNMEVDAAWLDASTYPDTMLDPQIDEQTRQMSQEATTNEIREEHEEARRELFRPQRPSRWQATAEVETLTAERRRSESGDSSRRTSLMRSQPRSRHLEASGSGGTTASCGRNHRYCLDSHEHRRGWNNSKHKQNQHRAGCHLETLARQAKLEKTRRKLVMEDVKKKNRGAVGGGCAGQKRLRVQNKKWKHERRDASADRRRSCRRNREGNLQIGHGRTSTKRHDILWGNDQEG